MPEPTTTVGVIVGAISMATLALLSVGCALKSPLIEPPSVQPAQRPA